MLATQNPVDLDYKALSNTGTWFLGKLQTERDKSRVLDGLEGVSSSWTREQLDKTLSALRSRVFLMHNVHEQEPITFDAVGTPYLRAADSGRAAAAMAIRRNRPARLNGRPVKRTRHLAAERSAEKPVLPAGITEYFLPSPVTSGV